MADIKQEYQKQAVVSFISGLLNGINKQKERQRLELEKQAIYTKGQQDNAYKTKVDYLTKLSQDKDPTKAKFAFNELKKMGIVNDTPKIDTSSQRYQDFFTGAGKYDYTKQKRDLTLQGLKLKNAELLARINKIKSGKSSGTGDSNKFDVNRIKAGIDAAEKTIKNILSKNKTGTKVKPYKLWSEQDRARFDKAQSTLDSFTTMLSTGEMFDPTTPPVGSDSPVVAPQIPGGNNDPWGIQPQDKEVNGVLYTKRNGKWYRVEN
jgi:hypothetical protein